MVPPWFRMKPNVLICGTPGTGKSTVAEIVAAELEFNIINVGDFAKEHGHVRSVRICLP